MRHFQEQPQKRPSASPAEGRRPQTRPTQDELSDELLDLVVGGAPVPLMEQEGFVALLNGPKARRPNDDGVVLLHSSLPGSGA